MKESSGIIFSRCSNYEGTRTPNLSKTAVSAAHSPRIICPYSTCNRIVLIVRTAAHLCAHYTAVKSYWYDIGVNSPRTMRPLKYHIAVIAYR